MKLNEEYESKEIIYFIFLYKKKINNQKNYIMKMNLLR